MSTSYTISVEETNELSDGESEKGAVRFPSDEEPDEKPKWPLEQQGGGDRQRRQFDSTVIVETKGCKKHQLTI